VALIASSSKTKPVKYIARSAIYKQTTAVDADMAYMTDTQDNNKYTAQA